MPIDLKNTKFGQANTTSNYNRGQHGVFGLNPLATPKYAKGEPRDAEFKDTLARMYLSLAGTDDTTKQLYLKTLPQDAQTQALAKVLIGSVNGPGTGFIDFFLQQVNESFQEVAQVDKVLGDNYVAFYFGQEPPVFTYSGTLLNSQQDDQRIGFALAYQHLLRGTSLARRGTLLRLRYDSVIVSGTVNSLSQSLNAENEMAVPFNFSLLVKEYLVFQQTPYTKVSVAQYVQLADAFSPVELSAVGQSNDTRARTAVVEPADTDEIPVETVGTVTLPPTRQEALLNKALQETTDYLDKALFDNDFDERQRAAAEEERRRRRDVTLR